MTTLDELRETLEDHAGPAPADAGLMPGVRARAARLRRRRRTQHGTALVVAIVVAAVTIPWAVRSTQHTPVPGPAAAPALWQAGIALRDGSKYQIMVRQGDTVAQFVQVHGKGDGDGVQVLAFKPGAFDPAALRRGEPMAIGGTPAWYVSRYTADLPGFPLMGPVLGWKDAATGSWVLVIGFSPMKEAGMIEVARDVRLGGNVEPLSPVTFGWSPPGLGMVQSYVDTGPGASAVSFGFGFGGEQGSVGITAFKTVLPFRFEASLKDPAKDWNNYEHDLKGLTPKIINGAQAWYLPGPNRLYSLSGPGTGDMVVAAGNCQITLHVSDKDRITEADLERMLGSATFGDCASATGWRPPLG